MRGVVCGVVGGAAWRRGVAAWRVVARRDLARGDVARCIAFGAACCGPMCRSVLACGGEARLWWSWVAWLALPLRKTALWAARACSGGVRESVYAVVCA